MNISESRELDSLVAEKVMGWTKRGDGYGMHNWWGDDKCAYIQEVARFTPSENISAAWMVVEKMREAGYGATIQAQHGGNNWICIGTHGVEGKSIPECICRAALLAVGRE